MSMSFAAHAGRAGGYIQSEIRALLLGGLRESGARAWAAGPSQGFSKTADWNIVVSPHEFFFHGRGKALRFTQWPGNVVLYNTAQADSPAFSFVRRLLPRAHAIWEIDRDNAARLRKEGWRASFVPMGFSAQSRLFPKARAPRQKRPIDFIFAGTSVPRRKRFFKRLPSRTFKKVVYLPEKIPSAATPAQAASRCRSWLKLERQSKIVLNIHRRDSRFFEWHRIGMHGMGQGSLVLSEPVNAPLWLKAGRDFIEAPIDDLPGALDYYLSSKDGQKEAETIARRGYESFRKSTLMARFISSAAKTLNLEEGPKALKTRRRHRAAVSLLR